MARIDAVAATSTRFATLAEDQLFAPPVLRPRARRSTKGSAFLFLVHSCLKGAC